MIDYVLLFVAGDRSRSISHKVEATNLEQAGLEGLALLATHAFGLGAAWELVGAWREDHAWMVAGVTEAEL